MEWQRRLQRSILAAPLAAYALRRRISASYHLRTYQQARPKQPQAGKRLKSCEMLACVLIWTVGQRVDESSTIRFFAMARRMRYLDSFYGAHRPIMMPEARLTSGRLHGIVQLTQAAAVEFGRLGADQRDPKRAHPRQERFGPTREKPASRARAVAGCWRLYRRDRRCRIFVA